MSYILHLGDPEGKEVLLNLLGRPGAPHVLLADSATGRVREPDISIASLDDEPVSNVDGMIDPLTRLKGLRGFNADRTQINGEGMVLEGTMLDDLKRFLGRRCPALGDL